MIWFLCSKDLAAGSGELFAGWSGSRAAVASDALMPSVARGDSRDVAQALWALAHAEPAREDRVAGEAGVGLAPVLAQAPELVQAEVEGQRAVAVAAQADPQIPIAT